MDHGVKIDVDYLGYSEYLNVTIEYIRSLSDEGKIALIDKIIKTSKKLEFIRKYGSIPLPDELK